MTEGWIAGLSDATRLAFALVARSSLEACVLIAVVLLLRATLGARLSPPWRNALWAIIGLRLLIPAGIETRWSVERIAWDLFSSPPIAASAPTSEPRAMTVAWATAGPPQPDAGPLARAAPARRPHWAGDGLALLWTGGVFVLLARRLVVGVRLRKHLRLLPTIDDPRVLAIAADAAARLGVRRRVRLAWSAGLRGPAVCGVWRPTIVLPSGAMLSPADLRVALLHEFAHVRRHDPFWAFLASALCAAHWFNPFVWAGASAAREDLELACDARVLVAADDRTRDDYGACLLRVVERSGRLRPRAAMLGASGSRRHLKRRIEMIANRPTLLRWPARLVGATALAAIGFAAATCAPRPSTPPAASPDRAAQRGPSVGLADASGVLDRRVDISADGLSLPALLEVLREKTGARIELGSGALRGANARADFTATMRLRDVTLKAALRAICAQGEDAIAFGVREDGSILVSTPDDVAAQTTSTRTYDVRDLLVTFPDFDPAAKAPAADEAKADRAAEREEIVERLVQLLLNTVDSSSWKDNGGTIGVVQELGGQLIVTQSAANHESIRTLLAHLRATRSVQISVAARFLSIDPDALPPDVAAQLPGKVGESTDAAFVPKEKVAELLRAVQLAGSASTLTAPRITLFNGQRAFVKVATQQAYISTYALSRNEAGERRFEPVIEEAESGVTFDVQATVSADRKYVTMTLKPLVTSLLRLESSPFAGDADEKGLLVQKPILETQSMSTTVSLPDGGTIVLRSGPGGAGGKQALLLLVTPTVIARREIDQPADDLPLLAED